MELTGVFVVGSFIYLLSFLDSTSLVIWHFSLWLIYLAVNGEHEHYHIEGLMESPAVDDDGDCFSPLVLNATSVNIEIYYNKAVNYTLMVTFVSFLCLLDLFLHLCIDHFFKGGKQFPYIYIFENLVGLLNKISLDLFPSSTSLNSANGT